MILSVCVLGSLARHPPTPFSHADGPGPVIEMANGELLLSDSGLVTSPPKLSMLLCNDRVTSAMANSQEY